MTCASLTWMALGVFFGQVLLLRYKINSFVPDKSLLLGDFGGGRINPISHADHKVVNHYSKGESVDLQKSVFNIPSKTNVTEVENTVGPGSSDDTLDNYVKHKVVPSKGRDKKPTFFLHSEFSRIETYGKQRHKVLIMVLSRREKIVNHLESLPGNWFREVDAFADIIYVVGGRAVQAATTVHRLVLDEDGTLQVGVLTLGKVSDVEYPPLTKTTMAYEFFSTRYEYDFVLKCDDDTYIHPSRLHTLLSGRNPKDVLYMGRPLHHCGCIKSGFDQKKDKCKKELGVHYCSGAAYVLSSATLEKMAPYWRSCRNLTNLASEHNFQCRSSDSTVGWCLNQAGIYPSRAIDDNSRTQFPEAGNSYAWPDAKSGYKRKVRTLFCQELHMDGGVNNRGVAGRPYLYPKKI